MWRRTSLRPRLVRAIARLHARGAFRLAERLVRRATQPHEAAEGLGEGRVRFPKILADGAELVGKVKASTPHASSRGKAVACRRT